MNRIEMLQQFVASSPKDPFPRYGLALELKNAGRLDEAEQVFTELMASFPDYTAAYLHAGNLLVARVKREEAGAVYRAGIAACGRKHDGHAKAELESALLALDQPTDDDQP